MKLTAEEQAWYSGEAGPAVAMAVRILVDMGRVLGADRLLPVTSAHIDGCLYHGDSGVHFAETLARGGGKVRVPTTLNVGAINLLQPEMIQLQGETREMAQRLMRAYVEMGCRQTWTCAPYQAGHRPALGEDIAWAESNAVVFANSVLGARTNRYGDFLDICAALTARVPRYGLHVPENRLATLCIHTNGLSESLKRRSAFYPVLGAWLGRTAGSQVAVIDGLPADVPEDSLKALGAAAAATGAVGLFHIAGVTPEAASLSEACGGREPLRTIDLTADDVLRARDSLSTVQGTQVDVIAVGSPHYSPLEIAAFEEFRQGRKFRLPVYINTSRFVVALLEKQGRVAEMRAAGVEFVTDTCIIVTPILKQGGGVLMTDSGKFAYYSPANIGYDVVYGSAQECVESAVLGHIVRMEETWK